MQLFYAPDLDLSLAHYTFSAEESRHCVRVLRLRAGDALQLTDGRGAWVRAEVEEAQQRACRVRLIEQQQLPTGRSYRLTMAVAPTKQMERLEWFVEKATEMGVDRIVPLLTEHSERRTLKKERLERVAISAMKQSLGAHLPVVEELTDFSAFLATKKESEVWLMGHCEAGEKLPLREAVQEAAEWVVLIGPEGDFSPTEIAAATACGVQAITLGESRLRSETAALMTVAAAAVAHPKK